MWLSLQLKILIFDVKLMKKDIRKKNYSQRIKGKKRLPSYLYF